MIGYAYSFKEVLVINSKKTDLDIGLRLYFDNGILKGELADVFNEGIPDNCDEEIKEILFRDNLECFKYDKNVVLIPYVSGSWKMIKDSVSEACLWLAGQVGISCPGDPLKLDRGDILENLYIYEGNNLLFNISGDVCDRCVAYCVESNFPLDSRSIIWPEQIDKAMKKWEKM